MLELASTLPLTQEDRLLQAEALVRSFCGWHVAPSRTETVTVRSAGRTVLLLPSMHVTAIASVTAAGTPLVIDQDFTWSAAGVLTHAGTWTRGDLVAVELTHGHSAVPAELEAVVRAVAQRAIDNPGSLARKQIGPFSETYSTTGASGQVSTLGLLDAEKDILRRYRIPAIG